MDNFSLGSLLQYIETRTCPAFPLMELDTIMIISLIHTLWLDISSLTVFEAKVFLSPLPVQARVTVSY